MGEPGIQVLATIGSGSRVLPIMYGFVDYCYYYLIVTIVIIVGSFFFL